MSYNKRLQRFQENLSALADVAFFPMSADLQYLIGTPPSPILAGLCTPARVADVIVVRPGGEKLTNGFQSLYVVD